MVTPKFYGNLATASSQAALFANTMAKLDSRSLTVQHDIRQLVSHAQVWVALHQSDGSSYRVVPAKFAAYDCNPADYSTHRRSMSGTRGATAIAKWSSPVSDKDPAFKAVITFCAEHGVPPRDEFRVLVAADIQPPAAPTPVAEASRRVADLVIALLPTLPDIERARVARAAARI